MFRIGGLSISGSHSGVSSSYSDSAGGATRYGLHDNIGCRANTTKVSDFVGSKSNNAIPSLLANATHKGDVVTVANSMAVMAAMGQGHGKVVVSDLSDAHLAGVKSVIALAEKNHNQDGWLKDVKKEHGSSYASHLSLLISRNGDDLSFEQLQRRIRNQDIAFYHVDLASSSASEIEKDTPHGVSAVYASNIEMYLGGFLSKDGKSFSERQQSLDSFKENLTGMLKHDGILIHGNTMGPMELHSYHDAINNWQPAAT
ncbi:hypothetical protein [Erwinia piriflorinigrans]|uniref:Uncharacterized protein n=1 Tax=Erwinia piriflorinigrans CFBP 5888 TaxID=1161919 RepID=V5Z409_9GAMM|nr:hypothetical protein [Erwinia piriflorinigrans]CCG85749.1 hypothetical protein EPIR_0384 [Erwinia piriflorinigrans CFBP 5888]